MAQNKRKPTKFMTNGIVIPKAECDHEFVVATWADASDAPEDEDLKQDLIHGYWNPTKPRCWKCGYVRKA